MVDEFSMFLKAEVVKSKKSKDIIPVLMLMITHFGAQGSCICICDNGSEFINQEVVAVLKSMCIIKSHITPYKSSSNLVERCHRGSAGAGVTKTQKISKKKNEKKFPKNLSIRQF
jgi:hypothetical protein